MIQGLPGFRDFFPEDCARRNHVVATWREVSRRYGFVEFDGPALESTDLYRKKNEAGAEILGLFSLLSPTRCPCSCPP